MNRDSRKYTHYETDSIIKGTLGINIIRIDKLGLKRFVAKVLSDLLTN